MKVETTAERQARLRPVLEQLLAQGQSVFLDLCELLLMLSDDIEGSVEWDHPRVVVKVRQIAAANRIAKRRGV
jgi:hypothetical protein